MDELKLAMYIALRIQGVSSGRALWYVDNHFSKFNPRNPFYNNPSKAFA